LSGATLVITELRVSRLIELSKLVAVWLRISSRRGVSAIEYGLLATLIALIIIAGVTKLGANLKTLFSQVSTSV
jgi:pilus assembly protein Flp/PilA